MITVKNVNILYRKSEVTKDLKNLGFIQGKIPWLIVSEAIKKNCEKYEYKKITSYFNGGIFWYLTHHY